MRVTVEFASEMGCTDVQIEGDVLSIISMMNRCGQDAKTLMASFHSISFFHRGRIFNVTAHTLTIFV